MFLRYARAKQAEQTAWTRRSELPANSWPQSYRPRSSWDRRRRGIKTRTWGTQMPSYPAHTYAFVMRLNVAAGFNHARHIEVAGWYSRGLAADTTLPTKEGQFVSAVLQPDGVGRAVTYVVPL